MATRVAVVSLLVCCCSFSPAHAQRERFREEDLGRWASISRIATDFEEFELTADQLDELKLNEIRLSRKLHRFNGEPGSASEYLDNVYKVLNDEQEARLHQIMFQRWMNRDDLVTALGTFAPGEISGLEQKAKKLQKKIAERLEKTIADLPKNQRDQADPLREFLRWRWEQQTQWLKSELGADRIQQLVGKPVELGYQFVTSGDPDEAGIQGPFGDSYGGGVWYGAGFGGWGSMNGVSTVTVGLDPVTGKAPQRHRRRTRWEAPKRPVDIPVGMTLADAEAKYRTLEEGMRQAYNEGALEIQELRDFRPGPGFNPANRRARFDEARKREEELGQELAVMNLAKEKLALIIKKLGGDPNAKKKAIEAAQRAFRSMPLICNAQPFVNHIQPTAKQCDQLDAVWDKYSGAGYMVDPDKEDAYHADILKVLDAKQRQLFRQQQFRRDWFSRNCERAFSFTNITLTDEQQAEVTKLAKALTATEKALRGNRSAAMRLPRVHIPGMIGIGDRRDQHGEVYLLLHEQFAKALEGIVGKDRATKLLGKPMEYDRGWKRPVEVPEGLTRGQANDRYAKLVAEQKLLRKKMEPDLDEPLGDEPFDFKAPAPEDVLLQKRLQREVQIARRIVEELGGTPDEF